jgi:hypothetical protein
MVKLFLQAFTRRMLTLKSRVNSLFASALTPQSYSKKLKYRSSRGICERSHLLGGAMKNLVIAFNVTSQIVFPQKLLPSWSTTKSFRHYLCT